MQLGIACDNCYCLSLSGDIPVTLIIAQTKDLVKYYCLPPTTGGDVQTEKKSF
jgi:hypothetical protein